MAQFYVYLHCKPDGDPFYVGKGTGRRAREFWGRNVHHQRIVAKYGASSIQVLKFERDSEREAFADELRWIAELRKAGFVLANMSEGGEGGCLGHSPSPETRERLSAALKGITRSTETRAKMAAAAIGNKRNLGNRMSEATRAKIAASALGNKRGLGNQHNVGRALSTEHKARISAAGKDQEHARRGQYLDFVFNQGA